MRPGAPNPQQIELRQWIEGLASARAAWPALTRGARAPVLVRPEVYVYTRTLEGSTVWVVLNRGAATTASLALDPLNPGDVEVILGAVEARVEGETLQLDIPAGAAALIGRR